MSAAALPALSTKQEHARASRQISKTDPLGGRGRSNSTIIIMGVVDLPDGKTKSRAYRSI